MEWVQDLMRSASAKDTKDLALTKLEIMKMLCTSTSNKHQATHPGFAPAAISSTSRSTSS